MKLRPPAAPEPERATRRRRGAPCNPSRAAAGPRQWGGPEPNLCLIHADPAHDIMLGVTGDSPQYGLLGDVSGRRSRST